MDLRWLLEGYAAFEESIPANDAEVFIGSATQSETLSHASSAGSDGPAVACLQGTVRPWPWCAVALCAATARNVGTTRFTLWHRLFRGALHVWSNDGDWSEFAGDDWADRIMGLEMQLTAFMQSEGPLDLPLDIAPAGSGRTAARNAWPSI